MAKADVKTEIFIDVKSVIESVIDHASRRNIDLIVIGTRGRTGVKRFLMGSVANDDNSHLDLNLDLRILLS